MSSFSAGKFRWLDEYLFSSSEYVDSVRQHAVCVVPKSVVIDRVDVRQRRRCFVQ